MAGRTNRIPRCPVCATMLSTDRTIEERWVRRHPGPDLWVYRLACPQCLTVALVEVPEVNALARSDPSSPVVDVAGAVVARLRERLDAAQRQGPHAIAEVLADAAAHEEHRVLLRIPEVLAASRPAFANGARLAEDLVLDWPALRDSSRPSGRLVLQRSARTLTDDPVVIVGEALELRLRAGRHVEIVGYEGGTLLLKPPRDAELLEWLADVEELVAWADFVVPRETT